MKVVVTGFGPFGEHRENVSWKAVKMLKENNLLPDLEVHIREIPVDYDECKGIIRSVWDSLNPQLVVHVGVSSIAERLTLEQQAHNDGYFKKDINGCTPCDQCCEDNGLECIKSDINMEKICDKINRSGSRVKAEVSDDPGRYLCDFAFYTSLNINKSCSAFIHVPPEDNPYTVTELAEGIAMAVKAMLQEI